jgi:hypothetical protein
VDLDEISYEVDAIEDDLYAILLSTVALTIQKWRMFKLLRWVQIFKGFVDLNKILHAGDDIEGDVDHSKTAKV